MNVDTRNSGICRVHPAGDRTADRREVIKLDEETKTRIPLWLYPSTMKRMDGWIENDNCKSRSEFIEKAVRFYMGYLSSDDCSEFLSRILLTTLRGTLDDSENKMARLLFKLSVELSMMMNVLAASIEISEADIEKLRAKCIGDVKKSNGAVAFKDAVRFQSGD